MNNWKSLLVFACAFLSAACSDHDGRLETALRLAGDNRAELEKVLVHYSQAKSDSLKYKAARFLIENMPGHYTLDDPILQKYRQVISDDTVLTTISKKTAEVALHWLLNVSDFAWRLEDVRHVNADFLIHHIDLVFKKREQYPWVGEIPFDMFLEYVLPYRIEYESLDGWMSDVCVDSAAIRALLLSDNEKYAPWKQPDFDPLEKDKGSSPFLVSRKLFGSNIYENCTHLSVLKNLKCKVMAYPAAIDFIPHYANRNGFHRWNRVIPLDTKSMFEEKITNYKVPKVYRMMFSRQTDLPVPDGEYVPSLFQVPFYKDVTDEYLHTADIVVPVASRIKPTTRYAYLAVFSNLKWQSVAVSSAQKREIPFRNMGKGILYCPVSYYGEQPKPLNYPFILDNEGRINPLVPDTNRRISVRVKRKYPTNRNLLRFVEDLDSLCLRASNRPVPSELDTVACLSVHDMTRREIRLKTNTPLRFWQIRIPALLACAEVVFFDEQGKIVRGQVAEKYKTLQDGDPLTNNSVNFHGEDCVTFDFGRPVAVSRIVLLPRSDGNGVYPGDDYELFYHDLDGWQSLGRRVATDYFLDYDNLPAGALYWLHNHTRGVEERPFTITPSGDIRFW